MSSYLGLDLIEFDTKVALREWLDSNHNNSLGIWIRMFKVGSNRRSISFEDLLDQGLCFGWSESLRHKGDAISYYQNLHHEKLKVQPRSEILCMPGSLFEMAK